MRCPFGTHFMWHILNGADARLDDEVDVDGRSSRWMSRASVSVTMRLKRRADGVTDGNMPDKVLSNAPDAREGFFAVPKVVE
jgi:aspartyl-tRNA(Asn)/glutamyl-tRNA(Gln) amidotransferase subunit C